MTDEKELDQHYKKCLTHIFYKHGNKLHSAKKDTGTAQMMEICKFFSSINTDLFNFWLVDLNGKIPTKSVVYTPKLQSLNTKLNERYKKERDSITDIKSREYYDELFQSIKKNICKEEGIEMV